MSADLGSLLVRAAEELSPSDGPDEARLSRVVRTVRRRRVRRHAVESAAGVMVASVVGTAVWAGLRLVPVPQPAAPPVTATPTPTAAPAPTVSLTPSPTLLAVPPTFGQPPSEPVTDAVLGSATEGWSLGLYIPSYYSEQTQEQWVGTITLYLLSPDGRRYRLLELPDDPPVMVNQLTYWKAGEPRALVNTFTREGHNDYAWLDLRTGELTASGRPDGALWLIGVTSTGSMLWQGSGVFHAVAPDGSATTYAAADCSVAEWQTNSFPALACGGLDDSGSLYRTLPTMLAEPSFTAGFGSHRAATVLPDGREVRVTTVDGVFGVFAVASDGTTTLVQDMGVEADMPVVEATVVGDTVFINQAMVVTAHDLASGEAHELMAMPTEPGEPYGLGTISWAGGPRWWVMGTAY